MPGKDKECVEKVAVLKGPAAEKMVLDYVKEMNRLFGAGMSKLFSSIRHELEFLQADIFANLKGAVAKASVQKILVGLAEKGEITQKAYAKTLVFIAKQADLGEMLVETLEALESEENKLVEENKVLAGKVKALTQDLAQLRIAPTNEELGVMLREADQTLFTLYQQLQPLRSGQSLLNADDLAHLDSEWKKWRALWMERRKVFHALRSIATDAMVPQECEDLDEELGIEYDTLEHKSLESGPLCAPAVKARR